VRLTSALAQRNLTAPQSRLILAYAVLERLVLSAALCVLHYFLLLRSPALCQFPRIFVSKELVIAQYFEFLLRKFGFVVMDSYLLDL